jgi:beta-lactam-binding protein with PASTA domain
MKPGFLNEVNEKEESLESFKQEKFVKIAAKKKPIWIIVLVLALVGSGSWFFFNQSTEVPDFAQWTLTDVNNWTESHEIQLVYKAVYSELPVDVIVSQDLLPGTQVKSDGVLVVEVSQGVDPEEVIVLPSFDSTWDKTALLNWLTEQQITNYRFEIVVDDQLENNMLVSYTVSDPSIDYKRSDEIVFLINQTAVVETLIMPDLSTSLLADIQVWALDSDIKLEVLEVFSDLIPVGKVVSQSVVPNTTLNSGSTLVLTLSKGAAIIVADFRTMDSSEAKTWATDNNLVLEVETLYSSVSEGALISQSVKANTSVEAKSKLTVVYSLGSSVTLGSYTNSTLSSLKSFIEAQNLLGAQLSLDITNQYSSTVSVNRIIAISENDAEIARGSTIEVVASLGALVKVPDFSSLVASDYHGTYNDILAAAKTANVTIRITTVDAPDSDVISIAQSVSVGTLCSSADILDITLTY